MPQEGFIINENSEFRINILILKMIKWLMTVKFWNLRQIIITGRYKYFHEESTWNY